MINIIKQLLLKVIQDIDAGNSNIDEKEAIEIVNTSNSADDKIIEAAMVFWFMDDDWKYEDKVESMYQLLNT